MTSQNFIIRLLLAAAVALCSACSTTTVDELRHSAAPISEGERVVVLGRRHNSGYETEPSFIECIGNRLPASRYDFEVISEFQFLDQLYPWFEPRTAPLSLARLGNMLQQPAVQRRVDALGLRYIIWVDGHTETEDQIGSISCAIGPGGGGCIGFGSWEDDASYEAKIWDVGNLAEVAKVKARTEGTSYMPAVVVPIPLLARVQANACEGLGDQLEALFEEE